MKRFLLSVFLIFGLVGTVNATTYTIAINPEWNLPGIHISECQRTIYDVMKEIEGAANIKFVYSTQPQIYVTSKKYSKKYIGWWSGKEIIINEFGVSGNKWDKEIFYGTCLHELCHAMGLGHDETPGSIMNASISTSNTIHLGPTDIENLIKKHGPKK